MKIFVVFALAILFVVYLRNRQKGQVERIRSRRRFEPDWGRARTGSRRRRFRFGGLRTRMTRLEEERARPVAGSEEPEPGHRSAQAPPGHRGT